MSECVRLVGERLRDKEMKILKTIGKVIAAPVFLCVFLLARCFQFFLKVCGAVVTFVCILAAVVLTIGIVTQIALQMQGRGPGIAAIIISVFVAAVLAYVPGAGVGAVMVVLEGICSWIMKFYKAALESVHIDHKKTGYKWADYDWDSNKVYNSVRNSTVGESERKIHYFKGIRTQEELKRRAWALLKIYQPDNRFGEDEITRSIMAEYDYLKKKLPKSSMEA